MKKIFLIFVFSPRIWFYSDVNTSHLRSKSPHVWDTESSIK